MGQGGIKNDQKNSDVFYERPPSLVLATFLIPCAVVFFQLNEFLSIFQYLAHVWVKSVHSTMQWIQSKWFWGFFFFSFYSSWNTPRSKKEISENISWIYFWPLALCSPIPRFSARSLEKPSLALFLFTFKRILNSQKRVTFKPIIYLWIWSSGRFLFQSWFGIYFKSSLHCAYGPPLTWKGDFGFHRWDGPLEIVIWQGKTINDVHFLVIFPSDTT